MAEAGARLKVGLWGGALALFAGGFLLFANAPGPDAVEAAGASVAVRTVKTQLVEAVQLRPRTEVSGILEARRSVKLFSETQGPVTGVGAEALDRVIEGQELVVIDPLQAEVAVERAAATVARNASELKLARSHLKRRKSLYEQGVASDADLEDAESAANVAVATLRLSRAELTRARDDLENRTINAPFQGVLRRFEVEEGEYVRSGQELGELLDLASVRATLGLSDREVVSVRAGQKVEVVVEAWPNEVFEGSILRVGAASDRDTKKFPVEVEVPNEFGRLLPGMVGRASFDLGAAGPRTVIPREATVDDFGLRFVWVLEDRDGVTVAARRRVAVRALPFRPGDFEVVDGLDEGEEIALTSIRELRDGEPVRRNGTPR